MKTNKDRIVIVGAGMAGLTAAAYLTKANFNVLLLEKNDRVGGLLHTFESDGFFFDSGPRAFVNSGIVQPILKDLGLAWDFFENKISIGIENHLFRVDSMDALMDYKRILIDLYPESRNDIEKIIPVMQKLSAYTEVLYDFDNPVFGDLMSDWKFVLGKMLPWMVKFLNALRKFNQFNMPMEEFMNGLTDNQSLIDVVTQSFFREMPTYFALGYFYVYLDYFYPKGGTAALAGLLEKAVLDYGGQIKLNKEIVAVKPAESKVIDAQGESYDYDHLIWAADLKTLYCNLDPAGLDVGLTDKIESEKQSMISSRGAESVFILFLAVNRPPSYFKSRGGEHMFYTPYKQGLGETLRGQRMSLIEDFERKTKADVMEWLDDFCRLNTYEVSVPVLRDPELAPEGQTGLSISCLFDYAIFEKIKKAGWYDEFKEKLEENIIKMFSRSIYEGLEEDVLFKFSSTPLTIKEVTGSSEGAITGWSFETESPVINKLKDIPKSVLTPMPGILQAGQWAYSPSGVPVAMLTGWYATQNIIKQSKQ